MTTNKTPYILGLDLDGTSGNYTQGLREFVAAERGIPETDLPEPLHYDMAASGWGFENFNDFLDTHGRAVRAGLFTTIKPMPGLKDALDELHEEGVRIRVVTHRLFHKGEYGRVVRDTVDWLDGHNIRFDGVCFDGLKDSIGASAYVDDSPANLKSIAAAGTHVFAFDQLYNRDLDVPRITDWRTDGVKQILAHKKQLGL